MKLRRLRTRVTVMFVGGALVLAAGVTVASFQITRHNLLDERERTAIRATYFDAAVVRPAVVGDDTDVVEALRALDTGQVRRPLIRKEGAWYARSADDGLTAAVPAELLTLVDGGAPGVQRVEVAGTPALVVGVPFRDRAAFYEVHSLAETQQTLRVLAGALGGVGLAALVAAAFLSRWVARRALSPLGAVARTARKVSEGDLTIRMPLTDDGDLRDLSEAFNDMVSQVEERVERERRFAADVSHELRSPLQTLASASEVLVNRQDLDERGRLAARLVAEEVERFRDLVLALLDLSQADRPAQLAIVEVLPVVRRAVVRQGLSEGVVTAERADLMWSLDARRLDQVLDNLLSNARKYGGGASAVSVAQRGGNLRIDVDDTGPGIALDERDIVFDRFSRGRAANTRGDSEGVGLGLSLVAEHVASHGGRVHVLERPGGGCRMRVEIPWSEPCEG